MDDLTRRFNYHPPRDDATKQAHEAVREMMKATAQFVSEVVPAGRESALAITKLEEAMMWANAGIARQGAA